MSERLFVAHVFGLGFVVLAAVCGIGPDDQQVFASFEPAVAGARRKDHHVACFQVESLAVGPAELRAHRAARDAEHFVRVRMKMQEVIHAVAPQILPAIRANKSSKIAAGSKRSGNRTGER